MTTAIAPRWFEVPFLHSLRESSTAATFRFSTEGTGFRYRPNQFVALQLDVDDPWGPVRRFSLSSSPTEEGILSITTKLTGSPYKERLLSLTPRDSAYAMGPIGHFILDETRPALMIAGGIGITPFRGMIRYAADRNLSEPIALLYSARTPDEFVFRRELDGIAGTWGKLDVTYTVTRPQEADEPWEGRVGRIDEELARDAAKRLGEPVYYVCGTPGMVDDMVYLLLRRLVVPRGDVRVEAFMGY